MRRDADARRGAGKIDQLGGFADAAQNGFDQRIPASGQGDDGAIVIGVHVAVELVDAVEAHGFGNGVDRRAVAALGEIGDGFNQSHG